MPGAAVFTEEEKVRMRHHMGYLDVLSAYTFQLGVPAGVQTQFMIEGAMDRVKFEAAPMVRTLICRLDNIENSLFCGADDFASTSKIGNIEFNPKRQRELANYYKVAQQSLANLLGIVPNPFDQRTWLSGDSINVPVY